MFLTDYYYFSSGNVSNYHYYRCELTSPLCDSDTLMEVRRWGKLLIFCFYTWLLKLNRVQYLEAMIKMAHTVYCSASHNRIREWCRRQTRTSQNILLSRNSNKIIISWTTGSRQKMTEHFIEKIKKNNKSKQQIPFPVKVLWIEQVGKSTQQHRVMIRTERRSDSESLLFKAEGENGGKKKVF